MPKTQNNKTKRLIFTLKEDSEDNRSSSSSDVSEIDLGDNDEEVPVFEEINGKKVQSKKLSYRMVHVEDRIGAKINLKDCYFDVQAQ